MTPRHEQAAALHDAHKRTLKGAASADKKAGGIRPGMSTWHIAVGQLVHRCAGELAEHRSEPRTVLAGHIIEWVNAAAKDTRVFGNLPKARAQISSMAGAYLFTYAPGPDAQYIGAELAFDGGRVDLAWFIPDLGVVIDELKTTAWVRLGVDNKMLEQSQRYREFGNDEWDDLFAGVRFLPLLNPHEARFIDVHGDVHRLSDSPARAIKENAA
ncbi:hypothetical protein [Microbacterium sp.]|uniref:hypothetical protein n=1 Tax=Microbacterium sp. TaxID=51671 RepID=UPI00273532F8|nr:hypothetical protein [Microbacterium sp.]MDP3950817.1 hypothetical protein [Microbacterium sp.]